MLEIVLTILKMIGIIVLCLLLTILVVAGLVLFVPIRYKASGYYRNEYAIKGKLSWLLHLITVRVGLQQDRELELVVRILGIPIYDMQKKKRKAERKAAKAKAERKEEAKLRNDEKTVKPPVPHRPGGEELSKALEEPDKDTKQILVENSLNDEHSEQDMSENESGSLRFFDKLKLIFRKCIETVTNIKYTFSKICDKIKEIKDNITYYSNLLQEENTKQAFAACKKELLRIWKDIKPKQFHVNALLGMEDPATTGQIIGYCAMLYPLHQGNVVIVPDFEDKILEADFALKGKITVYVYLVVAYTVFYNKNIRRLKRCLLREDS